MVPISMLGAYAGGWTTLLLPICTWGLFGVLDAFIGQTKDNADPQTPDADLYWYRLITLIWFPVQALLLFGLIWYTTRAPHLGGLEKIAIFFGMGVVSGTIGIVYAHELMHQKSKTERWLGDLLMASVLYSHFRSEHLRVHHLHVGTPKDAVTARYNEGFYRYFPRVLWQCLGSAWHAEAAMLARKSLPATHRSNPFWRYAALQITMLALAYALGGWQGIALFAFQAFGAVWQLELVDYVEHYGLTRRHLGAGKYEHVLPRHSWNAAHKASNWLLINLQRHSDHHYKPDRRFPLLQSHDETAAPQLPYSYPTMTAMAMVPPLWKRVMNGRVREWRKQNYPDIADWQAYNMGTNALGSGN
jgi:alkane 1-monooxygenase